MTLALRIFYRRIYLIGRENMPQSGPVILAVTHPSAFMDDILVAALNKRSMIFLARGDVFKKKFARILLKSFHIYPIFRPRDGKSEVHKNFGYIEEYQNKLAKGQVVLIHPEGLCVHEKNVRPLRKGMARIAFGAEERFNWDLNVQIVPIGLNYTNAPEPQEDAMVCVGKAIPASRYKDLYHENEAKAYTALNQEVFDALNNLSIIQVKGTEEVSEFCLQKAREGIKSKDFLINHEEDQFKVEKIISERINDLFLNNAEEYENLKQKIAQYSNQLTKHQLVLKDIEAHLLKNSSSYLIHPFRAMGHYLHLPLYHIIKNQTLKLIKSIEFKASILIGLGTVIFGLAYIALISLLSLLGFSKALLWLLAIASLAIIGRTFRHHRKRLKQHSRLKQLKQGNAEEFMQLEQLSSEIKKLSLPT